jgi:lipoprotein-anchoring transpeptidase ErfK/SrfK
MGELSRLYDEERPRLVRLVRRGRPLILVALALIALIAVAVILSGQWDGSTRQASASYHDRQRQLQQQLDQARSHGYTNQDLAPVTSRLAQVEAAREPVLPWSRPDFYRHQAAAISQLQGSLQGEEAQVLNESRVTASGHVDAARAEIQNDQQLGVDAASLQSFQARLAALVQGQQRATRLGDFRTLDAQANQLAADAKAMGKAQQLENQAIQQAAQQLIAQTGGNIDALKQIAGGIPGVRNEASIAAYLNYGNQFKADYQQLAVAYQRMERYAPLAGSADVNQVAQAAAAVQRYGGQVHQVLFSQLPAKMILVSFQDQHIWAYQNGQVAMQTPVTTGVRGVTDYGTDFGPLKVSSKDHPWQMKSPYPKGSPYYYDPTWVQWTVWFTPSKLESFHDASWEPDSQLGPNSQYDPSTRSHGCIHLPGGDAQWLYNWADIGIPVIVYPGNGQPVAEQLSEITTDAAGNPKTAA